MFSIRAISRPLKVTVLAKLLRKVSTPSTTKISRSCSVGRPSSLLPWICQTTSISLPLGSTFVPLISILPIRLPTLRSNTAKGMAARFSSSTERLTSAGLGLCLVTCGPFRTQSASSVFVTLVRHFVLQIYDQARGEPLFLLVSTHQTNQNSSPRSEEHTSELQSLPTRRSSDLLCFCNISQAFCSTDLRSSPWRAAVFIGKHTPNQPKLVATGFAMLVLVRVNQTINHSI